MLFVLIVSLYTSRVVLNTLGVVDYGIYNVVSGFVVLFSFLNATLSSTMQRFYNYEGTKNGITGFQSVYITGLIIHIALAILAICLLETVGLWYVNNVMKLPTTRLFSANVIYQMSAFSLVLFLLQIPYVGAIMAKEHMNFYALVSIVEVILKLILVIILPYIPYDKLISYGAILLVINIVNFLLYYIYCRFEFAEMRFKFSLDRKTLRQLMTFSGWNLLGTFAFMLKDQGVNLLLNYFTGPVVNAARGVAYQVSSAVGGFSQNISIAFRPQVVNSFADMDNHRVKTLIFTESRVCFMMVAALIAPLIVEMQFVLNLWLGEGVPPLTHIFTILVLVDTLICTLNTPITQLVMATGKIKVYQIASTLVNIMLLPICFIFLRLGYDAISVFVVAIFVSIINQAVCLIAANRVFRLDFSKYIKSVIIPSLVYALILMIANYLTHLLLEESFMRLVIVVLIDIVIAILLAYWLGLDYTQKSSLKNIISKLKTYKDA